MNKYSTTLLSMGLMVPMAVSAVGLGKISVYSALNQPFRGQIELVSLNGVPLSGIKVGLASPEAFDRAGLERPYSLGYLKFSVTRKNGKPVVLVKSLERMDEPFLQVLVDVTWAEGQYYRAYTVLLDPPGYKMAMEAAKKAPVIRKVRRKPRRPGVRDVNISTSVVRTPMPVNEANSIVTVYGPTVESDDLWAIAQRYKPRNLNSDQVMLAIYAMNPNAFVHGNINGLKKGVKLSIPSFKVMVSIPRDKARGEVNAHMQAWQNKSATINHVYKPTLSTHKSSPSLAKNTNKTHETLPIKKRLGNDDSEDNARAEKDDPIARQLNLNNSYVPESQFHKRKKRRTQTTINSQRMSSEEKEEDESTKFVPLHPVLQHVFDEADKRNKKQNKNPDELAMELKENVPTDKLLELTPPDVQSKKVLKSTDENSLQALREKNLDAELAVKAISSVKESNVLLKKQLQALTQQNRLLQIKTAKRDKELLRIQGKLDKLTQSFEKQFVINAEGEIVGLKGLVGNALGAEEGTSWGEFFLYLVIVLGLLTGGSLFFLYAWQQKQKNKHTGNEDDLAGTFGQSIPKSQGFKAVSAPVEEEKEDVKLKSERVTKKATSDVMDKKEVTKASVVSKAQSVDEAPSEAAAKENARVKVSQVKTSSPKVDVKEKRSGNTSYKADVDDNKKDINDLDDALHSQSPVAKVKTTTKMPKEALPKEKATQKETDLDFNLDDEKKKDDFVTPAKISQSKEEAKDKALDFKLDDTPKAKEGVTHKEEEKEDDSFALDFKLDDTPKAKEGVTHKEEEKEDDDSSNALDFNLADSATALKNSTAVEEKSTSGEDTSGDFTMDDLEKAAQDVSVKKESTKKENASNDMGVAPKLASALQASAPKENIEATSDENNKNTQQPVVENNEEKPQTNAEEKTTNTDLSTQLALAETYIAMEDWEAAKQSLEEVIAGGTDKQKSKAKSLMTQIKSK